MGQEKTPGLSSAGGVDSLLSNADIASRFHEMAALLELKGLEGFKLRAYRRAAAAIEEHQQPLVELFQQGRLREVPGVGESFALKITEIIQTGSCALLESLREEYPPAVLQLMRVPGVGPKTALLVWRELKVDDLDSLAAAAADGTLASLPGLGPKRAAALLAGIESVRRWGDRISVAVAAPLADAILRELRGYPEVSRAEAAGSLRRGRESVGDLDIVVASSDPGAVLQRFASLPAVLEVLVLGDTMASVRMRSISQVDVRAVSDVQFPTALVHFTGSREHNVRLREIAKGRKMRLNEYGLWPEESDQGQAEPAPVDLHSEAAVYAALGLQYVPPELREDRGEIESAVMGTLPNLIDRHHLRGDLHAHTRWTDGADEIRAMARAAGQLGHRYLAITDHSQALAFTGGLDPKRLAEQGLEIKRFNDANPAGPRLLHGCEVEILSDGSLDLPDETLASLDWVVAAVHSPNRRSGLDLTGRLLRAAENPLVDVIAHPTGQIIGVREAYDLDVRRLLAGAAKLGVALEINASPYRLDLPPELAREAARLGIKLVISTDAHDTRGLADLHYGVTAARRGWLTAGDVLNTLDLADLIRWQSARREGR